MKKILILLQIMAGAYLGAVDNFNEMIVTGTGRVAVKASFADVKIGIEAEAKTSGEVQQSVTARLKATLDQLRGTQVEKLQTSVVNVYSIINPANPSMVSGYRARIDISFSIPTERAPDLIEKSFKAGANQLLSLTFRPDDKSVAVARLNALQAACENAILEARTVSEALGISSSKIIFVKIEPSQPIQEFKAGDVINPNVQISTSAGTEIIQQEQTIQALVTLRLVLNN